MGLGLRRTLQRIVVHDWSITAKNAGVDGSWPQEGAGAAWLARTTQAPVPDLPSTAIKQSGISFTACVKQELCVQPEFIHV